MSIRSRIIAVADPYAHMAQFAAAIPDEMDAVGREVFQRLEQPLLTDLRTYPGSVVHPFQFATEKSRRWYFAAIASGIIRTSGGRYQRTGGLADSWQVDYLLNENGFIIRVKSDYKGTKYVVGSFDRSRNYQVPGHKNTGWRLVLPVVDRWLDIAKKDFEDTASRRLKELARLKTIRRNR